MRTYAQFNSDLYYANARNEAFRHCRIGKVREKRALPQWLPYRDEGMRWFGTAEPHTYPAPDRIRGWLVTT